MRWYLGYDLAEPLPDHSSLTRIRDRYGLDVFRRFFDTVVEQCQQAGRIWGQELYLDATQVKANASLNSLAPRFAVEAHLTTLFTPTDPPGTPPNPAVQQGADLRPQAEVPSDLAEHNTQRHAWIDEAGRPDRSIRRGGYRRRSDFEASQTDPGAALMAHKRGGLHTGYHDHVVVDGGKASIIYDKDRAPYHKNVTSSSCAAT